MSVARRAVRIESTGATVALHLDRLADVADQDAVQSAVESAEAGLARGLPECRLEQVPVQPELIAAIQDPPALTAGTQERFRVGVDGPQAGEERLAVEGMMAHQVPEDGQHDGVAVAGTRRVSRSGQDFSRPGPGDSLGPRPARRAGVGEHGLVQSPPLDHQDLREPAQWCFLAGLAGLPQRLDERLEVEEVISRQGALGQERPFQAAEHADAEVVEDAAVGVRLPAELAVAGADVRARQLQGREEPGEGRRGGDGHRHRGQADVDAVDAERVARLPAHHQQAVPVERAQAALAQVGGEEVQLRASRAARTGWYRRRDTSRSGIPAARCASACGSSAPAAGAARGAGAPGGSGG